MVIQILRNSFPTYDDLVKVRETMVKMNKQSSFDQFKMLRKLAAKRKSKNPHRRRMTMKIEQDIKKNSSDDDDDDDKKGTKF